MSPELEALLYERYPLLFAGRHLSPQETSMCWGCTCGDGWFMLLDTLCERLQWWCDHNETPQVVLTQVKEKFGELRVHQRGASPEQRGMIEMARALSARSCEVCGHLGRRAGLPDEVDAHTCSAGIIPR